MPSQIRELWNLHNKLSDRIKIDRIQSEEIGKWIPISISLLTFTLGLVITHFIYFERTLTSVFYAVQSYALVSLAFIVIIWGLYPIIRTVIPNKQLKLADITLPIKLLPQSIEGSKVIVFLTVPLFITLLLASIPLLYSSISSILSNMQLPHVYVFSFLIVSLVLSVIFLKFNGQIYNKLNPHDNTIFELFFYDKFLLEKIGYLLTIAVISIFSLVIFFALLLPHLNIFIAYQFWISFVFILLMYLSIASVYSYLNCKKELSTKMKKSLIQYYLVDSYIRKNQIIKNDEFEKLKNEVNQNLSPLIVKNVKLLKLVPFFFILNLDEI